MVMKMLRAGGVPWTPDASDVGGECAGFDAAVSAVAPGVAVKVLLGRESQARAIRGVNRRVVWCTRDAKEQARSMAKFARRIGLVDKDAEFADANARALPGQNRAALTILRRSGTPVLVLDYAATLRDPLGAARRIGEFVPEFPFDVEAAAAVVMARSARSS